MSTTTNTHTSESAILSKQYQRKTDRQHILDNPDTYIGSVENVDAVMWVFDEESLCKKQWNMFPDSINYLMKAL